METLTLTFFPLPYELDGERHAGYRFSWPAPCDRCSAECRTSTGREVSVCSRGLNFARFDNRVFAFGFIMPTSTPSAAQVKVSRQFPANRVSPAEVDRARALYLSVVEKHTEDIRAQKRAVVDQYIQEKRFQDDFLAQLRSDIQRSLSVTHDYRQFVARIRQHINVILEAQYPGVTLDQKLAKASPSEKAIYWATALMEEKLQTALLLLHPERLNNQGEAAVFRLHGLVTKYLRIYQAAFDEKAVRVTVTGNSVGTVRGNAQAVAVIPHTLIDNALKYSRRDSQVGIKFEESEHDIVLSVTSYGPRIGPGEREKIFDLFYRGQDAQRFEEEGAGFGLYLAQFVAIRMGTKIEVEQERSQTSHLGHFTRFSVRFCRES